MHLNVYVEDQLIRVDIPTEIVDHAGDYFDMMDRDMDKGWKMGPTYVENPDPVMRAQIAASKMLTAIDNGNQKLLALLAGYIVSRRPGTTGIRIATDGDLMSTELLTD